MSYVVLARKYRPQDFETLVGQRSVSQTLANALSSGRIAHAYVFSGPRGVGKTTTARILAKCLNCEKGTSLNPCNQCASCLAIAQGTSMQDVLEIDGASNRGIEQIRDLRDNAKYAPTSSRYRIFIIDEAHQITKDAFGALLKTLEEPPAHVVFMMATTEVQKIPAPILSRCQRFALRPISPDLVLTHLKEICEKEKIKIDEPALADIVRFVEGSLRDALSLLDQAVVYAPEGITSQTLRELLGLLPRETVSAFAKTIAQGEPGAILQAIHQAVQNGIDLTQLAKDLEDYYHQILLSKAGVSDPLSQTKADLESVAKNIDYSTLERSIRLLSRALFEMRNSDTPRAIFEITAVKLGQKVMDPRVILERLEKLKAGSFQAPPIKPIFNNPKPPMAPVSQPQAKIISTPKTDLTSNEATPIQKNPSPQTSSADIDLSTWPKILDIVGHQKFSLGAALESAEVEIDHGQLVLTFSKQFHQQTVSRAQDILVQILRNQWGFSPPLQYRVIEASPSKTDPELATASPLHTLPPPLLVEDKADELEVISADQAGDGVKDILKQFPGTLKRVKKPT